MRRTLSTLLALCLCLCAAGARGTEVVLLSSLQETHHDRYRAALERAIAPAGLSERRLTPPPGGEAAAPDLVIAAGPDACERALALPRPPVLCVFVSESTYRRLAPQARTARHSALFLEQPLERRFNLARLLLPPRSGLSVLLPAAAPPARAVRLQAQAQRAGVPLSILRLPAGHNPARLIQQHLDRDRMLLALPDPAVYNRHTIHGILLTTYRKGIAVIGFSESFVTAGAIAAVHSTPEDFAAATAELAAELLAGTDAGPPAPAHPSRFSVTLNRRVARALSLDLPPEARLHRQLLDMESGTR